MRYLVTGGAGYIGSHMCLRLLQDGAQVTVLDNFANSSPVALERIREICGKSPDFVEGDLCEPGLVNGVLASASFAGVIHFAGLKAVGESVREPLRYFQNNLAGTLNLLEAMRKTGVRTMVFSSSATVYGMPDRIPIPEDSPCCAVNPYGRSKLMVEEVLADLHVADPSWKIARLRYFNPVGAHPSGRIGEDPRGTPNNLMPFVCQVAAGQKDCLSIFGGDYATADGTGVRDYIHVLDLVDGHLAALRYLANDPGASVLTLNLGTGKGYSVLELVKTFEDATGRPVPYRFTQRRQGDVASCYADPSLAARTLGWRATRDLREMCTDAWRWQAANPRGYAS